ncbi:MAG: gamma-butyrobetaine hydroxylase [Pelagibacteraceae bacterium]|nr:gamma-butyrobetaine hydroxylase [Pelagibacteraceae bacterium]|tara:strand:+ start:2716 stop:3858 length:1143 start_codon:yes stop_codon:yes gene_type:complete
MNQTTKISRLSNDNSSINVQWEDGQISNFNYLWLRDNCPCDIDVHPTARERRFNLIDVSENIKPKSYKINIDGKLEIKWDEGDHISSFDQKWLRNHCYTINNNKEYCSPYKLWDNSLDLSKVTIDCSEIMDSEEGLINWLEILNQFGIAIVKNAPTENNSGLKVINKISHVRETFFGTPFEVIDIPNPNNSAYTAGKLHNHTDLPYYEYAPGYQFLHCLINEVDGGMSSIVDGFKVSDFLRNNNPEVFDTLVNTYVKFKNNDFTQETIRFFHAPLITLNKDKDYNDIRFSVSTMGIIDCGPKDVEKFYKAYRKFAGLLHSEDYSVKFRLNKGDIFSFNNRRTVHGRTKYNPNSGHRHLQGYYLDRDEILGKLNYLKKIEL